MWSCSCTPWRTRCDSAVQALEAGLALATEIGSARWIGNVTALIFAEKALLIGRQVRLLVGVALVAYGAVVVFVPAALPMAM